MKCIAINDESIYANIVNKICPTVESINKFKRYDNINEAVGELRNDETEVVFLDFTLSNIEKLDIFKLFPNPPKIILVSLNSSQKLKFFSVNINNKHLYPISEANFLSFIGGSSSKDLEPQLKNTNVENSSKSENNGFMFIKVGSSIVKVIYDEIKYIEGLKDYIKIYTNGGKALVTKCTIKHIEQKLPTYQFIRIHKSYIISFNKIDKIEFNHTFINEIKIPIGAQFRERFLMRVNSYRL